ncbi:MAG: CorA family divalent cation transporter [Thermoprotei archaeon]
MLVFVLGVNRSFREVSPRELSVVSGSLVVVTSDLGEYEKALSVLGVPSEVIGIVRRISRYKRVYPAVRIVKNNYVFALRIPVGTTKHLQVINAYTVLSDRYVVLWISSLNRELRERLESIASKTSSIYGFLAGVLEEALTGINSVLEGLLDTLESMESRIIETREYRGIGDALTTIKGFLHSVRRARRIVYGYRELVDRILSSVSDENLIHLRDYLLRDSLELVEYSTARIHDFINIYLSIQNTRLSDIMRLLTIVGTIFIPLTFITGIYGMNFDPNASPWNMPELKHPYGYPLTLLGMLIIGIAMTIYFKKKKWL